MKIAFDLDDTICFRNNDEGGGVEKYHACKPVPHMVDIVNECYDKGHEVVIYTARGMSVFKGNRDEIIHNLYDLTREQLERWGIKYHKLVMGKLHYDLLVDDKVLNVEDVKETEDVLSMFKRTI